MEKNWLIRTKSNHILGPVSKEKVLELYRNGTIKPDDEICSGNGYWFFIREEELVDKYLLGSEVQSFNPISEAKDVLTAGEERPTQKDEDITMVGSINTSLLNQVNEKPQQPIVTESAASEENTPPKKKSRIKAPVGKSVVRNKKVMKKQNYLQYIGIFCFLILFLLVYFRKNIIRSLFQGEITLTSFVLSSAHAQDDLVSKKKSSQSALIS